MYHSSCTELTNISKHVFWRFLNSFDTVLTGCEGVLWNSDKEIKGSSTALNRLREIGKQIFFFTNNSMRTREDVVQHAENLGILIHQIKQLMNHVFSSYLVKRIHPQRKNQKRVRGRNTKFKSSKNSPISIFRNAIKNHPPAFTAVHIVGIPKKNEVISSSYLTALYLRSHNFNGTAYVIGSRGVIHELESVGITHIGTGPDLPSNTIHDTYIDAEIDPNVKAVVVGLDEYFSFPKLIKAATYLQDPTCEFVALCSEERRSGFSPKCVPSTGAILTAIETCSGRKAKIIGKPSSIIKEFLKSHHCVDEQRTLLLGDRLTIDVLLGHECGFQTLIVLSGMTQAEELDAKIRSRFLGENRNGLLPDLYTKSLEDMIPYLILKEHES